MRELGSYLRRFGENLEKRMKVRGKGILFTLFAKKDMALPAYGEEL